MNETEGRRRQMGAIDAYYTPPWLAQEVAEALPAAVAGRVLDPTVGGGALLAAASKRFGDSVSPLGIDVDRDAVLELRSREPKWTISRANVLVPASRRASAAWKLATSELEAVVLNPPFSQRGMGGQHLRIGAFAGRVAPSLKFLGEALNGLHPRYGFFAILPEGAIEAERHQGVWEEIRRAFTVELIHRFRPSSFRGARVSTALVHVASGASPSRQPPRFEGLAIPCACRCVEVVRGRVPVHSVARSEPLDPVPFLHTTSIGVMRRAPEWAAPRALADHAPFVVINRVGRWVSPFAVEVGTLVLSDCLIALRPRDRFALGALHADLQTHASEIQDAYKGTGAPYLTLSRVVALLEAMGWHPHIVKASSEVAACCCSAAGSRCSQVADTAPPMHAATEMA